MLYIWVLRDNGVYIMLFMFSLTKYFYIEEQQSKTNKRYRKQFDVSWRFSHSFIFSYFLGNVSFTKMFLSIHRINHNIPLRTIMFLVVKIYDILKNLWSLKLICSYTSLWFLWSIWHTCLNAIKIGWLIIFSS